MTGLLEILPVLSAELPQLTAQVEALVSRSGAVRRNALALVEAYRAKREAAEATAEDVQEVLRALREAADEHGQELEGALARVEESAAAVAAGVDEGLRALGAE